LATTLLTAPSQRGRIDLTAKIKDTKSAAILDANAGIQIDYPNPPRIQTDASTIAPTRASRPPASFQNNDQSNSDGEQYLSLYAGAALDWINLLKSAPTGTSLDPLNMAAEIAVHLSAPEMNRIPAFDPGDRNRQRAQDLIAQLAQAQRADGAFVLGANADEPEDYLTTEIIDILNRARDRGLSVPAATLERGFKRLAQITAGADRPLAGRAYALYLLARVRAIELTEAQSFADSYSARLLGPQARAHTAAALMILGDRERARRIYAGSTLGERVIVQRNDAASLKDMAGALALGVEHRILRADEWQPLADAVAAKASKLNTLSASERIAIVLAAPALLHRSGSIVVNIDGTAAAETNQPLFRRYKPGAIPPLVVTNLGKTAIQRVDTRLTWPRAIAQAGSAISLKRSFFLADGRPADLNRVRRGELLTVVLEGKAEFGGRAQLALTDVTPAGLTIEGAAPSAKAVISASRTQIDANIGLDEQTRSFRLSYLARASFAGKFQVPAARVVDLQVPEHHANTSDGRMIISAD
jgi:uncharacterized protein YfaS (alpha-2-macroglobulin family)